MKIKKRYPINNRRTDDLLKEKLAAEEKYLGQLDIFVIDVLAAVSENPEEIYELFTINEEHNPLLYK